MNIVSINENTIELSHLPQYIHSALSQSREEKYFGTLAEAVAVAERESIIGTLKHTGGAKREAAKLLGVSTTTLWRKIVELGIETNISIR